jgi:hypothetical protein
MCDSNSPLLGLIRVRHLVHIIMLEPILKQLYPVRTSTSYFSKMHFNFCILSTPKCHKWALSSSLSEKNFVCISYFPHVSHVPCQSRSPCFHHIKQEHESHIFSHLFLYPFCVLESFSALCSKHSESMRETKIYNPAK